MLGRTRATCDGFKEIQFASSLWLIGARPLSTIRGRNYPSPAHRSATAKIDTAIYSVAFSLSSGTTTSCIFGSNKLRSPTSSSCSDHRRSTQPNCSTCFCWPWPLSMDLMQRQGELDHFDLPMVRALYRQRVLILVCIQYLGRMDPLEYQCRRRASKKGSLRRSPNKTMLWYVSCRQRPQ